MPSYTALDFDLTTVLHPGDRVLVSQGVCEPVGLTAALREQRAQLPEVSVFVGFSLTGLFDTEMAQSVPLSSYGAMGSLAGVHDAGLLDVIPCNYSDLPGLIRDGAVGADVVMVQVTPPEENGDCFTGISMDFTVDAIRNARVVLAEINDRLPRSPHSVTIPYERLTVAGSVSRPLIEVPTTAPTDVDTAIAREVANLIPDGATVQLGIGSTVTALGRLLTDRRDLRVHSALVGDWLLDLVDAGAITTADGPSIVTGAAMGSLDLYEFVAHDPRVELRRIEQMQRPEVLAALSGFVAVNSALQVDLAGQVNAEMLGDRRVSALGGHTEFLRGAQTSPGGTSIVALPATAGKQRASRIVKCLDSGWVTTPQATIDVVVTENGVAHLRGTSLRHRRALLAAIADPAHHDLLNM